MCSISMFSIPCCSILRDLYPYSLIKRDGNEVRVGIECNKRGRYIYLKGKGSHWWSMSWNSPQLSPCHLPKIQKLKLIVNKNKGQRILVKKVCRLDIMNLSLYRSHSICISFLFILVFFFFLKKWRALHIYDQVIGRNKSSSYTIFF
jgi:hypothetical protein